MLAQALALAKLAGSSKVSKVLARAVRAVKNSSPGREGFGTVAAAAAAKKAMREARARFVKTPKVRRKPIPDGKVGGWVFA